MAPVLLLDDFGAAAQLISYRPRGVGCADAAAAHDDAAGRESGL